MDLFEAARKVLPISGKLVRQALSPLAGGKPVGVEKLGSSEICQKLGDTKPLGKQKKSLIGHLDAFQFRRTFER
jgi:hypothetical protein